MLGDWPQQESAAEHANMDDWTSDRESYTHFKIIILMFSNEGTEVIA